MDLEVIYVRGGDKTAPTIAAACGMQYGIRHDYTPYDDVFMLDIHWRAYDWQDYLTKVRAYKPTIAMCADFERPEQYTDLMQQMIDLRPLVSRVMVCPKFDSALAMIPDWALIAVSVPAPTYAGFIPPIEYLRGRDVHLLGGRPELQAELMTKIQAVGGQIVSVDGSYMAMKAAHGQWFTGGKWQQVSGETTANLTIASGKNIVRYLRRAQQYKQPALF
jgi:hypothetical protein